MGKTFTIRANWMSAGISKKRWIFLDDERNPSSVLWSNHVYRRLGDWDYEVIVCRDMNAVLDALKNYKIEHMSFDHDLGLVDENGDEITGYTILKKLIEMHSGGELSNLPTCSFHSRNPIGVENMRSYYENYLKLLEL